MAHAAPHPPTRERAIEEHLPLVMQTARRFARSGEPLDDLVQAGSLGLIKAVDAFDPARGTPLAAFASPFIEGEIRHHLRSRRRHATRETAATVEAAADDTHERSAVRLLLARGWRTLSERERRLLELRFFHDLTQAEIARRLDISQAQVSRLLRATLERLAEELGDPVAAPRDATYSASQMAASGEPEERPAHSGRLLVRMPQSLHAELARAAEAEGVSLNTLVTGALAGAVGWRDGTQPHDEDPTEDAAPADPRRRSLMSYALAANFAVVAIAAVAAIVLLIVAWQSA